MKTYIQCWIDVAAALFAQALAGAPELSESLPKPLSSNSFGFAATLAGDPQGRFSIVLDGAILDSPLVGEGVDQKAGWSELLREIADAASGELLAKSGQTCRVEKFEEISGESQVTHAFQLRSSERAWTILVRDELHSAQPSIPAAQRPAAKEAAEEPGSTMGSTVNSPSNAHAPGSATGLSPGIELLLDVELETSLRFGCCEMPLGDILDLGPGDVVQLDRHLSDPVDLIVSDKIVARGEVVLVNGNFGLRITEVAAPRKRLETIRCLF